VHYSFVNVQVIGMPFKGLTYLWCNCAVLGKVVAIMMLVATVASIGCLVGGTALFFSLYEVAMKEFPLKLESLNLTSLPIPEELLPNTASKIHTYSIVFASIITLLAVTLYSGICGFVRAARNSSHAGALRDLKRPRLTAHALLPLSHLHRLAIDGCFKSEILFQVKRQEKMFTLMGIKPRRGNCCEDAFRRIVWLITFSVVFFFANIIHAVPIVGTLLYIYFIAAFIGWWYHDGFFIEAFGRCELCAQGQLITALSGPMGTKHAAFGFIIILMYRSVGLSLAHSLSLSLTSSESHRARSPPSFLLHPPRTLCSLCWWCFPILRIGFQIGSWLWARDEMLVLRARQRAAARQHPWDQFLLHREMTDPTAPLLA
jgi:hypothetical protein